MARYVSPGLHVPYTPAATLAAGILVQVGGAVGILDAQPDGTDWASGDDARASVGVIVEIANSGVIFAQGAVVGYDQSADNAVAAAGGDFDCGVCVEAATATQKVKVLLSRD